MRKPVADNLNDDLVLWERVTSNVKPIKSARYSQQKPAPLRSTPPKAGKPKGQGKLDKRPLRGTPTSTTAPQKVGPVDLRAGEHAGLDKSTRRKLFRGDVPVTRRLDLHGMTAAQAEQRVSGFVQESALRGHRCVLIITGKGARGDGVLRRHVPIWLKKPSVAGMVLAIAEARPSDGGAGALYILLRRKRGAL